MICGVSYVFYSHTQLSYVCEYMLGWGCLWEVKGVLQMEGEGVRVVAEIKTPTPPGTASQQQAQYQTRLQESRGNEALVRF